MGGATCADCHQPQVREWTGSDHDRAMDHARPDTVLGDFNNTQLTHHGVTSRMFQRDGKYYINTEGPDGQMQDFQVKYVFGVDPLQQYLVEFDRTADMPEGEVGRLQVLRVSWDTRQKKWFYLAPPDVPEKLAPDDPLHWTRAAQNWNHMCAVCHSTNLRKNFDLATATFHTTYTDIDVNCETCHGPGSLHLQLARARSLFWDRRRGYGLTRTLKGSTAAVQIQTCAPCHSRRRTIHPDEPPGQAYYDCYANALLAPALYYPDGQPLDEVYVYGSFLQSKMYHKGVRCTDCHSPHSTKIKLQGNALCTSCHAAHPVAKYDTPGHHQHNIGSPGAQCVNCHMPATPFMDIDDRRDHSLRVPRPDLSVALAVPNACTGCHLQRENVAAEKRATLINYAAWLKVARQGDAEVQQELDRVNRWAADWLRKWYGERPAQEATAHFAHTLAAAWQGDRQAIPALGRLAGDNQVAAIVRASALAQLAQMSPSDAWPLAATLIHDTDPQLRIAAVSSFESMPDRERLRAATPALADTVRAVRTEAARILAGFADTAFDPAHRELRNKALAEYRRGLEQNNDQANAHMGLGLLAEAQQDLPAAVAAYRNAIHVQADVTGPRSNLAALLEQNGQVGEAQKLRREELDLLARDAKLVPDNPWVQYRWGLALHLQERSADAVERLERACQLDPDEPTFRLGLTLLYQHQRRWSEADTSIRRLRELVPDDPGIEQLEQQIGRRQVQ